MSSYHLIERLSYEDHSVLVEGHEIPVPSVVEDDDGGRILLLSMDHLVQGFLPTHWERASSAGVAALVYVTDAGFSALPADLFVERYQVGALGTLLPTSLPEPWGQPPTFREIVESEVAAEEQRAARPRRFVSLHVHSHYSALDGYSTVAELVAAAVSDGQHALALTDHGVCAGHPDLQAECEKYGIKPIFGLEAYLVDDRLRRGQSWVDESGAKQSDAREVLQNYWHICLWALGNTGLRNLWAISTEGYDSGFYGKPRVDWDTLDRLGADVAASTGCLGGPVAEFLKAGDEIGAREVLAKLMERFPDRLYVELHTNHLPEQIAVNRKLVELAREYGLPLLAVSDSHYTSKEETPTHAAWMAAQTNTTLLDDTGMFGGGQSYHHHTACEVAEALDYLGADVVREAMANTVALADRCTARLERKPRTPVFSKGPDGARRDIERLREERRKNWDRRVGGKPNQEAYRARDEREAKLFEDRGLCGYVLITADIVNYAKQNRVLVGPCRGSGGASLTLYLTGTTEIDPIRYKLPFERFLTEERVEMPDVDLDFPSSKRDFIQDYIYERYGREYVVRIGTHLKLGCKSAINAARRVLAGTLPYDADYRDFQAVTAIIDGYAATLAGATVKWEKLWATHGEQLQPYRDKYPEIFDLAQRIVGRVNSYGKHPAGMCISTDPDEKLTYLPLRSDGQGGMVTQFSHEQMDWLGWLKWDILTLRTLDTLQEAADLIFERTGHQIDFYGWRDDQEYADPQVYDALCGGHTLGVFQIETSSGTKLTVQLQPRSVEDLAVIAALNRPGPLDSGLTEKYLRRRAGTEPVAYLDDRLSTVLDDTYGTMIYQEQIIGACQALAGYGPGEADTKVRKVLGKKKIELIDETGAEFVRRAIECGTDRRVADELWDSMKEFAKYSFNKAHSVGYAVLGYWAAWLKVHYPLEFLVSALSTVDADDVADFITEARRIGYRVLPPDINESDQGFTPAPGLVIRYGLSKLKGIGPTPARQIREARPYTDFDDFVTRVLQGAGSKVNIGHVAVLARIGAFDSLWPNRKALEMHIADLSAGVDKRCRHWDPEAKHPTTGLPCRFDWTTEVDPPMVGSGRGAARVYSPAPPPRACSVRCRQFTARPPLDPATVDPYTDDEIREREREVLGQYLSSTPFDRVPAELLAETALADDVTSGSNGEYVVIGMLTRRTERRDRNNNLYAWLTLQDRNGGTLDVACWSKVYADRRPELRTDRLIAVVVRKNDRGVSVEDVWVV